MTSILTVMDLTSFINHSYNDYSKNIRQIISNFDMSTLIPLTLPNGVIICYNIYTLDITNSIIKYDKNINSLLLYKMTLSCENLIKICNIVIDNFIENLYFVKCDFQNTSENNISIDYYIKLITKTFFINSICINSKEAHFDNGFDILFNCMFKIIPKHINFIGYNQLTNDEFQVFNKLLNYYNINDYYFGLKICDLEENNFKQFLETLTVNTTITNLSLTGLSSLQYYNRLNYKDYDNLIIQLFNILSKNTSIIKLNLSDLNISSLYTYLFVNLINNNKTLLKLNLSGNKILFNDGVSSFTKALTKNVSLTSLTMSINYCSMIKDIVKVLNKNIGLTTLNLETYSGKVYNNFNDIVVNNLKSNSTLTSLSLKCYTSKEEREYWDDDNYPLFYKLSYP